jgi:hypothetical protein
MMYAQTRTLSSANNQEILQKDATQNSTQRGQKRGHHTQDKPGHSDTLGAETTKTKTKQP